MSSFSSLAPLAKVFPDTRPPQQDAVPPVPPVTPVTASRPSADGLPDGLPQGLAAKPAAGTTEGRDAHAHKLEQTALEEINQALRLASIGLQFEFDKESDQMIARVVDITSGEVIRQMPSQEMVQVAKMLDKLQGLIFHRSA